MVRGNWPDLCTLWGGLQVGPKPMSVLVVGFWPPDRWFVDVVSLYRHLMPRNYLINEIHFLLFKIFVFQIRFNSLNLSSWNIE